MNDRLDEALANGAGGVVFRELEEGERIEGLVMRLPAPGAFCGNSLLLRTDDALVALPATAKKGHAVLERKLVQHEVRVGDWVAIRYPGRRRTQDGEREYRHYDVAKEPAR